MKKYEYEIPSNMDIYTFYELRQSSQGELKEKLDNIPINILQPDIGLKRYDAGTYYNLVNDDGSYLALVQTAHSTNILSRKLVDNNYIYKAIYFEIYSNDIIFKYYENDMNGSTHKPKMYVNRPVSPKEKPFYYTIDEVRPLVDELFSEAEKYDGVNEIINLKEYRENIDKYLEGVKRR